MKNQNSFVQRLKLVRRNLHEFIVRAPFTSKILLKTLLNILETIDETITNEQLLCVKFPKYLRIVMKKTLVW